jgi:hypothetical protein
MENLKDVFQKAVNELLQDKKLGDKDLMANPVDLNADKSYPIDAGDVTFSIGAKAALGIQLFNDENDADPDKLIATKNAPVTFTPATEAYLKYIADVSAKANGNADLSSIGFNLESSLDLKSGYYSKHGSADKIKDAFISDLGEFLTIFKFDDIKKLAVGNLLFFKAEGKLKSNLKISWSNIFTQSMSSLTSSLPFPLTLDIKLTPTLSAEFAVEIHDTFEYVIKKVQGNRCRVSVNKTKSQNTSGSFGASVGVEFSKPDELKTQLNDLLDKIIKSIFKFSTTDIDKAIQDVKDKVASEEQKSSLGQVAKTLGLTGYVDNIIDAIEQKWTALKSKVNDSIGTVAKLNATLSFSYEYEKISEGSELLSLEMDTASLEGYHGELLRFNSHRLLTDLRRPGGIPSANQISYLNQQSLEIKKTWGFGFTVFDFSLFGKDFSDSKPTRRINLQNQQQISIVNSRGYKWKLGKGSGTWLTEVTANMPSFSAGVNPTMNEFQLKIYMNMALTDPHVTEADLRHYLDLSVLWQCMSQSDVDAVVNKYLPSLNNQQATFETKFSITESGTKTIFDQILGNGWNDTNKALMAKSMAAAMPYWSDFPIRTNVAAREAAYQSLWLTYLSDPEIDLSSLAHMAYDIIRKFPGNEMLAALEKNAGYSNTGLALADVIYTNPNLFVDCSAFIKGVSDLEGKVNSNFPFGNFPSKNRVDESYPKMAQFFTQSFYVRTLGSFLLRYANGNPLLRKEVTSVTTITYTEGGQEQSVNISKI